MIEDSLYMFYAVIHKDDRNVLYVGQTRVSLKSRLLEHKKKYEHDIDIKLIYSNKLIKNIAFKLENDLIGRARHKTKYKIRNKASNDIFFMTSEENKRYEDSRRELYDAVEKHISNDGIWID